MSEKYDKYLPATKPSSEVSKETKPYSPTDYLEPKQIKFCEMKVLASSLSDDQIAQRLNIDSARIKKWNRNQHVKALINELKRKMVDQDLIEKMKRQTEELLDMTYSEAKTRFEDPFSEENKRIYLNLDSAAEKEAFYARFAYFSAHDKLVRTFNELSKGMRMVMPENVEQLQEVQLKEMMVSFRNNYEEGRLRRLEMEKAGRQSDQPLSPYSFKKSNTKKKSADIVDVDLDDIESMSIRTITVRSSNGKEEESED